ncbi:MAG: ABC transporter permease [Acidobacteriota bacterium]
MGMLGRKLLRDLWGIRGQVLTIAMVIGVGIGMLVMYLTVFTSLRTTQTAYYAQQRFGEVFAGATRAPRSAEARIAALPGVDRVATRVVVDVLLDVPALEAPATGRLISLADPPASRLNAPVLRSGRWPARSDEVVASEAFVSGHAMPLGAQLSAVINGRKRHLTVVGTALSPEYIYAIRPGEMIPDDRHFGVLWMPRRALATAFDMEGGFNDVSLTLLPGVRAEAVIPALDRLLDPYGGRGAIPRSLQISHWSLEEELRGLHGASRIVPSIFLGVAALLVHVALGRVVAVQRQQIAVLKALGRSARAIALHYAGWGAAVAVLGTLIGVPFGLWLGRGMMDLYLDFYRFPLDLYRTSPLIVGRAFLVGLVAGLLGAWSGVRHAARLPPAEAMRPAAPESHRLRWPETTALFQLLPLPGRIVLRNLRRTPVRTGLSALGIAFASAVMVAGLFMVDAIDVMIQQQFDGIRRQDATVTFVQPRSNDALHALARLPGVLRVEPQRSVAARLRSGHRSRVVAIEGLHPAPELRRVIDGDPTRPIRLPPHGVVMTRQLAMRLALRPGDPVRIEVLEGNRPVRTSVVVDLIDEPMGLAVYMADAPLNRLLREAGSLSGAFLQVDANALSALYRRLKAIPAVAGVDMRHTALRNIREQMEKGFGVMVTFNILFASLIAFGVVYNAARVSLSERARELASLRVMGFTRREIGTILLGELALLTAMAIPVGLALGTAMAAGIVEAFATDLYRFPLVISPRTLAASAAVTGLAALVSGLIVKRRLAKLDLIAVLKTRE